MDSADFVAEWSSQTPQCEKYPGSIQDLHCGGSPLVVKTNDKVRGMVAVRKNDETTGLHTTLDGKLSAYSWENDNKVIEPFKGFQKVT